MFTNRLFARFSVILLMAPLLLMQCSNSHPDVTIVNFAFGPDETGSLQTLIDQFNLENEGLIKVEWQKQSSVTGEYYDRLQALFESDPKQIDVFGTDVIWTPALASSNLCSDLSSHFNEEFKPSHFVEPAMNSVIYQNKIWGIPWYTDMGLIYYRKDLLQDAGYDNPPTTWQQMKTVITEVKRLSAIENGFVFQGHNSEAGVTNACEFIWNAGGDILLEDPVTGEQMITINNDRSKKGLGIAAALIEEGYAPAEVIHLKEPECLELFSTGKAIFMRNWPTFFGEIGQERGNISKEQVGLAPLFVEDQNAVSRSCLGGWNLMINPNIKEEKSEAAWKFIAHLTSPTSQRFLAHQGGHLPSLTELYTDKMLLEQAPTVALASTFIANGRSRPFSAEYMQMSPIISQMYQDVLQNKLSIDDAAKRIDVQLNELVTAAD